jgi:dihydrodipicolinate synthase/N-acetylneuraminate lyase
VKIDSVVAWKQDVDLSYLIDTPVRFGKRLNSFAGGSYEWFLAGQPYGMTAYFDTYSTFAPEISARFWRAVREKDLSEQMAINLKYERPFLADFTHAWWHATLEYFGVAPRYLRPPQNSYTDEEMNSVKAFFDSAGLHPRRA